MTFEEWWEKDSGWYDGEPLLSEGHLAESAWNAATEAAKPRWIPVSERLPTKEGEYPVISRLYENWVKRQLKNGGWVFTQENEITHWLELPELPE